MVERVVAAPTPRRFSEIGRRACCGLPRCISGVQLTSDPMVRRKWNLLVGHLESLVKDGRFVGIYLDSANLRFARHLRVKEKAPARIASRECHERNLGPERMDRLGQESQKSSASHSIY